MKYSLVKSAVTGRVLRKRQTGAITMISAVLILILLTEMIIYAVQVGVFEQRKSSNEMRQKEAFHLADSAIQFGKEFMLANSVLIPSNKDDKLPDGTDGWLSATGLRWEKCQDANLNTAQGTHPCYGEPADAAAKAAGEVPANLRDNMYYYSFGNTNPTNLPIDVSSLLANSTQQVSMHALLCMLDIERTPANRTVQPNAIIQGCTLDPAKQDPRYYMVTLMARGEADCSGGTCRAKALVTDKIGSFGPGGGEGGPAVPLTTKSTFPPSGTSEIVPNPNGGGVGVPVSAWMNANTSCPGGAVVDPTGGSWATCERQEWYGVDILPADYKCPGNNCACKKGERLLSEGKGNSAKIGMDLVSDTNFPCDLFEFMFGVPKDAAGIDFVKYGLATKILNNCSSLDENSFGIIWISGESCTVNGNTQVGSAEAPVFLISAAGNTKFNGGASLFGTLFVTDAERSDAEFDAVGTMTIYGAAVIDAELAKYNGTFQVVYVENVVEQSVQTGGFGAVAGAWSDFHTDWR
jgi:hypothetical protein